MKGTLITISAVSALVGASIASVSNFQDIEVPWAPRAVVYGNSVALIGIQRDNLTTLLLRNQVGQNALDNVDEGVSVLYQEQELDFKNRIEKLDRELEGIKK